MQSCRRPPGYASRRNARSGVIAQARCANKRARAERLARHRRHLLHVWTCNCSLMAADAKAAPAARVGDGYHTLTFLRKNGPRGASRAKMLDYLLGLDSGAVERSKSTEMCVAQAYRLEPLSGEKRGHMVVDGELVDYAPCKCKCSPDLPPSSVWLEILFLLLHLLFTS